LIQINNLIYRKFDLLFLSSEFKISSALSQAKPPTNAKGKRERPSMEMTSFGPSQPRI